LALGDEAEDDGEDRPEPAGHEDHQARDEGRDGEAVGGRAVVAGTWIRRRIATRLWITTGRRIATWARGWVLPGRRRVGRRRRVGILVGRPVRRQRRTS